MAKRPTKPAASKTTGSKTPNLDRLSPAQRRDAVAALRSVADKMAGAVGAGGVGAGVVNVTAGGAGRAGHRFYKAGGTGSGRERRNWADRRGSDRLPGRKTLTEMVRGDMAARCADLKRNNTIARTLANRVCDHTIGDGWVFEFNSGDPEFDRRAEERVNAFAERTKLLWAIRGATEAGLFDGDRLIHKVNAQGETVLDEIEGARIVTPDESGVKALGYDDGTLVVRPNGNTIVAGIERDKFGRVVAYHVASWGDQEKAELSAAATGKDARTRGGTVGGPLGLGTVVPVAANRCAFMAWPLQREPGRTRGEPGFQASLARFFLVDKFIGDVLIASDMATLFGLIVRVANPALERETDGEQLTDIIDMAAAVASGEDPEMVLEAGMVKYIGNADSVEQVKPEHPTVNHRDFLMVNMQIIAAEQNLPMSIAMYEFGGLTASNAKTQLAIMQRGNLAIQDWQITDGVRPLTDWDLATAIAQGELDLPRGAEVDKLGGPTKAWKRYTITPPAPPVTNLKEEVDGLTAGMDRNLITGRQATRQLGSGNFLEIVKKRGEERQHEEDSGAAPVLTPGAKTAGNSAGAGKNKADQPVEPAAATPAAGGADPANQNAAPAAGADVNVGKTEFLVGDKTAAIDIAKQTKAGTITREAGVAVLKTMLGLDDAVASVIATEADRAPTTKTAATTDSAMTAV